MEKFLKQYQSVLRMALTSGVPVLTSWGEPKYPPKLSSKQKIDFYKACHRGFDRAQNFIFERLCEIDKDDSIKDYEKRFRSLLLRKVMDSIAFHLFQGQIHVMRRLILHDFPNFVDLEVTKETLMYANELNKESRLTFAVVSDMATFIHIGDIIRIDFRDKPKVEIIELKSGKCNSVISDFLDNFLNSDETINVIKQCKLIPKKYKKQAVRMMKQRVRLAQVEEVLSKEKGIDIKLKKPIRFSTYTHIVSEYDDILNNICNQANEDGIAAGVVNDCIHIFCATGISKLNCYRNIQQIISHCISMHRRDRPEILEMDEKLQKYITLKEIFRIIDPISLNLNTCACKPLPLWGISPDNLIKIVDGKLGILFVFDISGFFYNLEDIGFSVRLSSRRETDNVIKEFGKFNVPTWGNRLVKIDAGHGEITLLSGTFNRIINSLQSPRSLLQSYIKETKLN